MRRYLHAYDCVIWRIDDSTEQDISKNPKKSGDGCHGEKKARDIVGGENLVHESEREKSVIK